MNTEEYIAIEDRYGAHNYRPLDVVISHAEGIWVYDVEGKKYMDFLSAYSAMNQGHYHPRILKALQDQAQRAVVVGSILVVSSDVFFSVHAFSYAISTTSDEMYHPYLVAVFDFVSLVFILGDDLAIYVDHDHVEGELAPLQQQVHGHSLFPLDLELAVVGSYHRLNLYAASPPPPPRGSQCAPA